MSAKPSILREKLKAATADEILKAAESELGEHGLAATSMSSIAKRAGVSVGTLYNYFKDKDELLSTLLRERRHTLGSLLEEAVKANEPLPFEAQLEAVVNTIFDVFEGHRDFLRIVLSNEKPPTPDVPGGARKAPGFFFIDRLRPLAARGVAEGVLASEDQDLYAAVLGSLMRAVMIERLADTSRSFRAATPFVLRMFLDGARRR